MLDVHQRTGLHNHLAEVMIRLADVLRGEVAGHAVAETAAQLLLDRAVITVADQRRSQISQLAQPLMLDVGARGLEGGLGEQPLRGAAMVTIEGVLLEEDDWVRGHSELLSGYGTELLRTAARFGKTEYITSQALEDVARVVIGALAPLGKQDHLSVLDPTCGVATLASAAADSLGPAQVTVCGQDINYQAAHRAAQNLFVAGRDASVVVGDLLSEDAFPGQLFDVVVADGPYGVAWRPSPEIQQDPRFQLGYPPHSDSTFLFIQAMLAKLKQPDAGGGVGVFFTHLSTLMSSKPSLSALRQKVMELDVLHAIVALPEGLNVASSIRLYALVFNSRKPDAWKGHTQVVDLRPHYEDNPSGPERRRLTDQALEGLRRSVSTPTGSAIARVASPADFSFRGLEIRPAGQRDMASARTRRVGFHLQVRSDVDQQNWLATRYPLGAHPEVYDSGHTQMLWDVDRVLPSPDRLTVMKSLERIGWRTTRLSAFVDQMDYLRSSAAPERSEHLARLAGQIRLVVPIDAAHIASAGDPLEVVSTHRCLVLALRSGLDPDFLAGWLNSATGRLARLVASTATGFIGSPRTVSASEAWRLTDEIIVPVPDPSLQETFAAARVALAAGQRRLSEVDALIWQSPSSVGEARRTAERLLASGSLGDWAETLPYPLAASLRTAEARVRDDIAAAAQLLHFWEATAVFLASYLLGALGQDQSLWDTEVPRLTEALGNAHLSFDRASFGTWRITIERLSRLFRDGLNSEDADEKARFRQILGNAPRDLTERLLSTNVARLLDRANATRNTMDGHGATMSARQAHAHNIVWRTLTEELRDAIGSGWADFHLVRAGRMDFDGTSFRIDVELMFGPATPFVHDQLILGRPLSAGELYLISPTNDVVPLAPFIQLGDVTDDTDYTCYFYNQRNPDGLRMVAYHLASENEITTQLPKLIALLDALRQATDQPISPDLSPLAPSVGES